MQNAIHSQNGTYWRNLEAQLAKGRDAVSGHWRLLPNSSLSREDAEMEWLQLCITHRSTTDHLVAAWIATGAIPEDDQQRFFVAARIEAARFHIHAMAYLKGGGWVSPFPPIAEEDVLSLLLFDWWWGVGVFNFFANEWEIPATMD